MPKKKRMTIEDLARIIQDDVIGKMATKDDLSRMATKEDLADAVAKMATKEDLARMATKEDLTRAIEDLAGTIQDDVVSQMATKDDIHRIEEHLERIEQRQDEHGRRLDHVDIHLSDLGVSHRRLVTTLASKRILTMDEARGLSGA